MRIHTQQHCLKGNFTNYFETKLFVSSYACFLHGNDENDNIGGSGLKNNRSFESFPDSYFFSPNGTATKRSITQRKRVGYSHSKSGYGRGLLIDGRVMVRECHVSLFFSKLFSNLTTTTTLLCSLSKKMVNPFGYASVQDPDLNPDSKPDLSKDQVHYKSYQIRYNEEPKKAPFR